MNERILTHSDALNEALRQALEADPAVFVMGQGVDDPFAMHGCTRGLAARFGEKRVFDTPLSEAALAGVALGAALNGMRPVYMHNRPDFLLLAMDQIANHAAPWRVMFGGAAGRAPLVIWAASGRGWGAAAQHSQALHGLFLHVPGIKIALPATPYDAKGLMTVAIRDPGPVLVFDHRDNFSFSGPVPEEAYAVPFGKGVIRRQGRDLTIAAVSRMVREALSAAETLAGRGIEAEVLDLRSIRPIDHDLIAESTAGTGRLLVCDTGYPVGGLAAEVAATAAERIFGKLKAPPARLALPDCAAPAGPTLEAAYFPDAARVVRAAIDLMRR